MDLFVTASKAASICSMQYKEVMKDNDSIFIALEQHGWINIAYYISVSRPDTTIIVQHHNMLQFSVQSQHICQNIYCSRQKKIVFLLWLIIAVLLNVRIIFIGHLAHPNY